VTKAGLPGWPAYLSLSRFGAVMSRPDNPDNYFESPRTLQNKVAPEFTLLKANVLWPIFIFVLPLLALIGYMLGVWILR
jgi:hypothetical protein